MGRYNNPYDEQNKYETYADKQRYAQRVYNSTQNNRGYNYGSRNYDYDLNNSGNYDNGDDEGYKGIPWFWVFVLLVTFPPIGVFLLFLKLIKLFSGAAVKSVPKKKKVKQKTEFSTKKLLRIGSIAFVIIGALVLSSALQSLIMGGFSTAMLWLLVQGGLFITGSLLMNNSLQKQVKKESLQKRYLTVIGNRPYMAVGELAAIIGTNKESCRESLNEMIEKGMLPDSAYVDMRRDMLVLNAALLPEEEKKAASEETKEGYLGILQEIRNLNDEIKDERISERIATIESITAQIFGEVEKNPQKLPQIRHFLNYYLPTTLKLLRAYASLEEQWSEGENINTAKTDIERIMDTLVECYKLQLDKLFANEKLDISSDIQVLENMMARDGIGSGVLHAAGSK